MSGVQPWVVWGILGLVLGFSEVSMAIEEAKYEVSLRTEAYEIRVYGSTLVAETEVDSNFESAGSAAFRVLADYIFGNNQKKLKIEMTAPVTQESTSQKIAMTAPVNQVQQGSGFLVQFTMPSQFTLATLPEPVDPRVHVRMLPPRRVAVFRYSGSWSVEHYEQKLSEFRALLAKDGLSTTGEPTFARYNSPFQLWFLRRNEIWIEVNGSEDLK